MITKSVHEALGIPSKEVNAAGIRLTRQVLRLLEGRRWPLDDDVETEEAMIVGEATAVLDRTLDLGDGDWALGAVRAVEAGVIDVPWSPSRFNAGKAHPGRDRFGAVRYLTHGNIPLPREAVDYRRARLGDRAGGEPSGLMSQRLLKDLMAVSQPASGSFDAGGWGTGPPHPPPPPRRGRGAR